MRFDVVVNVNIHFPTDPALERKLDAILQTLATHTVKLEKIMRTEAEWKEVLDSIDTATSSLAERVGNLIDGMGLTAEQEEQFFARVAPIKAVLDGIAKSPDAPVPPEPTPEPEPQP